MELFIGNLEERKLFKDDETTEIFKEFCKNNNFYREQVCDKVKNNKGSFHIYEGKRVCCHDEEDAKKMTDFLREYEDKLDGFIQFRFPLDNPNEVIENDDCPF